MQRPRTGLVPIARRRPASPGNLGWEMVWTCPLWRPPGAAAV